VKTRQSKLFGGAMQGRRLFSGGEDNSQTSNEAQQAKENA